ncbi:MAG: TAXI family TRAP transporter solute-binding subunit [bacterium]
MANLTVPKKVARRSAAILLTLGLAAGAAWADVPRSGTLATHAVGSLYNALGAGIATVLSRHSGMLVRVQPFAGPPAWLPSMNTGATDMGVLTGADAVTSYKGIKLYKRAFRNTRLLLVGGALQLSFYVPKDSPMETVADLKGKRIPTGFAGIPIVKLSSTAALATAGLTYADIVRVPVSHLGTGNQAFIEGRTDAGWHALRSPAVEEANARRGGIKFLSIIGTPEGAKKMGDIYPGSYPVVVRPGRVTGILKPTTVLTNDAYLVATKHMSRETAYTMVKVLWEHNKELGAAHRALRGWRTQRMVSAKALIPYHPGVVKFYKEKGVWNDRMDALQAKLMAQ